MRKLVRWDTSDPATGFSGNYMGPDYSEFLIFLGRNRDSGHIDNSNFEVGLARLGGESETVQIIRTGHWACGWVEIIGIKDNDKDSINKAEKMLKDLDDYPVLSDDDLSSREWDAACAYWESLSDNERQELAVQYNCTIDPGYPLSIPSDDSGSLFEMLRGD